MPDAIPRDPNLQTLLDRIVDAYDPERVYLFGSRATGTAHADSDYDLLVVVPDDTPRDMLGPVAAWNRVVRGTGIAADVFPCRRRTFETTKDDIGSVTHAAVHQGRVIYGRSPEDDPPSDADLRAWLAELADAEAKLRAALLPPPAGE